MRGPPSLHIEHSAPSLYQRTALVSLSSASEKKQWMGSNALCRCLTPPSSPRVYGARRCPLSRHTSLATPSSIRGLATVSKCYILRHVPGTSTLLPEVPWVRSWIMQGSQTYPHLSWKWTTVLTPYLPISARLAKNPGFCRAAPYHWHALGTTLAEKRTFVAIGQKDRQVNPRTRNDSS